MIEKKREKMQDKMNERDEIQEYFLPCCHVKSHSNKVVLDFNLQSVSLKF